MARKGWFSKQLKNKTNVSLLLPCPLCGRVPRIRENTRKFYDTGGIGRDEKDYYIECEYCNFVIRY